MKYGREQDRLGWWPAGVSVALLFFTLMYNATSSAGALDLDREIARANADSAQIVNTLGHSRGAKPTSAEQSDKAKEVRVEMIPSRRLNQKRRAG